MGMCDTDIEGLLYAPDVLQLMPFMYGMVAVVVAHPMKQSSTYCNYQNKLMTTLSRMIRLHYHTKISVIHW